MSAPKTVRHVERVRLAAEMLSKGYYKHQIKKAFREKFDIGHKQTQIYITRARKMLVELAGEDREELLGRSLSLYRSFVKDETQDARMRLLAQQRIDKLLGLEQPIQQNLFVSGKSEQVVRVEYVDEAINQRGFDIAYDDTN